MRRLRRALPVLIGLLLVSAAVAVLVYLRKAAPPEPARLLPGADAFLYVNLNWARRLGSIGDLPPVTHEPDYEAFVRETGIEFERDLEEAAFAIHYPTGTGITPGKNPPDSARFSEVLVGHLNAQHLGGYLRKQASSVDQESGVEIFNIPVENRIVRFAILDPKTVAASNHDDPQVIRGMIQRSRKRASPFAGPSLLRANYKKVPLASLAWAIIRLDPEKKSGIELPLDASVLFDKPGVLVASARMLRALHLRAEAVSSNEADARALAARMDTFLTLFRGADISTSTGPGDPDIKAFQESLQLRQEHQSTVLTASLPPSFLGKILRSPSTFGAEAPGQAEKEEPANSKKKTPAAVR
jgi:hypothetical protein